MIQECESASDYADYTVSFLCAGLHLSAFPYSCVSVFFLAAIPVPTWMMKE